MKTLFSIGLTLGPKGPDVKREYRELIESQFASVPQFKEQRFDRLQAVLVHAYQNCPFYQDRFDKAGFQPLQMTDLQELHKLPQLTKDDLVGHADELLAINFTENELHRSATGGSTGRHTPFFRDNACRSRKLANQYRHMCWAGWRPGQRVSLYWPALQDVGHSQTLKQWIKETWITRQQMLYAGRLDEEILAKHAASMSRFRPALIRFSQPVISPGQVFTRQRHPRTPARDHHGGRTFACQSKDPV